MITISLSMIVKNFTSKVFDFKWIDDFSAARNFSFSHATQDYILWLDADDLLLEEDRSKLNCCRSIPCPGFFYE